MKFIFIALVFVSNLALAQALDADVPHTTPIENANQDTKDTTVQPSHSQKKHVKNAAKKAKVNKNKNKNKKSKTHKVSKKKKKKAVKKTT